MYCYKKLERIHSFSLTSFRYKLGTEMEGGKGLTDGMLADSCQMCWKYPQGWKYIWSTW